ncbi:hypothetical protein AB4514_21475 [Vibrio cyclitrophicus]|uniref:hypothetical protein n=1 Tax=Vibrio crassostreae TaxID=246167 RepID=UPI00104A73A2|nr:hypothetical protein [Vibrio crassostreae]
MDQCDEDFSGELIDFKLVKDGQTASIHVYDDDRDVYIEVKCIPEMLPQVTSMFSSIVPVEKVGEVGYVPVNNPPSSDLVAAAEAACNCLVSNGYEILMEKRSHWQLQGNK